MSRCGEQAPLSIGKGSGRRAGRATGRRAMMVAAAAALTGPVLPSRPAQAALHCVRADPYGTEYCQAGIDNRMRSV